MEKKIDSRNGAKSGEKNKKKRKTRIEDGQRKPHSSYLAAASASVSKPPADPQKRAMDYIHCLLMLFKCRGDAFAYKYKLGTSIEDAMKFGDLVFFYTKDDQEYYRCLQSIHTTTKKKSIDLNKLVTDANSDFSLVRYFFSYIDLKQQDLFKKLINRDVIVYTNIPLNLESIIGPKMVSEETWEMLNVKKGDYKKKLKDLVTMVEEPDDILDVMEEKNQYRFNDIIVPTLKPKINNFNMTRVSLNLIKWLEKKETHLTEHLVKPYWGFLAKYVFDVDAKKLYDDFFNGTVNEEVQIFRNVFISALNKKDLTIKELNALVSDVVIFPDWETSHDIDLNNVIVDDDIKDFLKQFVLAVNQPSCEELNAIIKKEFTDRKRKMLEDHKNEAIRRFFNNMLNDLCKKVLKAEGEDDEEEDTDTETEESEEEEEEEEEEKEEEVDEKLKEALGSSLYIQFDLKEPDKFFIGREKQMQDMHDKIKRIQSNPNEVQMAMINGPSGIGKTELVRAYIQKHGLAHFDKNVIWINGQCWASIERSFNRLAVDKLMISPINENGTVKKTEKLLEDVYEMLGHRKCLVVMDGVTSQEDVENYMPKTKIAPYQPFFLITATNLTWKPRESSGTTSRDEMMRVISRMLRGMEVPD
ncbi:uncharacterized protein LOC143909280 [Arctopsyche grandis]|uniref:uncharacterized protein LOC143909280 n=1 Tax=Arctopsyche grandis TaxID=121162 RepID=UPI00406D82E2